MGSARTAVGFFGNIFWCGMVLSSWIEKHFGDLLKEIKKCNMELAKLQVMPQSKEMMDESWSMEKIMGALLRKESHLDE